MILAYLEAQIASFEHHIRAVAISEALPHNVSGSLAHVLSIQIEIKLLIEEVLEVFPLRN